MALELWVKKTGTKMMEIFDYFLYRFYSVCAKYSKEVLAFNSGVLDYLAYSVWSSAPIASEVVL